MNPIPRIFQSISSSLASSAASSDSPYRMPQPPENRDDGPAMEVVDERGRPLALRSARVRATAGAGLARIVVEQTFENPYDETLRITYRMPLPADGAVSGYAFELGDRAITGVVDRRERARERFEEALLQGKTAALLDQERADVFTQQIGNVPARATIRARITVDVRLAWLPEGEWELRVPTVIGKRYLGGVSPEAARAVDVSVAPSGISARLHLELVVHDAIVGDGRPTSPSHPLATTDDGVTVLREVAGAPLDRDVVVRWRVAEPEPSATLVVGRPASGPHASHAYGLLTIVPPEPRGQTHVARDLVVLLDTSGSMSGAPLEQAKRVVARIVDSLADGDTLELVSFSDAPRRFAPKPVAATSASKAEALAWLRELRAGGGTEMETAVLEALSALRRGAQRQVVLVTDGYIGGEERIVTRLHENLPESCRMHVVGVGSGVNRTLSTSIARAGRGAEVLVGLDEDAERAAKRLVDRTAAPVLTDVVIEGDALVDHAPDQVPDVFAGAPVLAAVRLRPEGGTITVRGALAVGTFARTIHVAPAARGSGELAAAALYAREAVADREVRWTIGQDRSDIDRDIETLGLVFQIATRKTSWVAIDDAKSVDPTKGSRHEEVPQELPYGTTAASFGLGGPAGGRLAASITASGAMPAGFALPAFAPPPPPAMKAIPTSPCRRDAPAPASSGAEPAPSFQVAPVTAREETKAEEMPAPAPSAAPTPTPAPTRPRSRLWLVLFLALLVLFLALVLARILR